MTSPTYAEYDFVVVSNRLPVDRGTDANGAALAHTEFALRSTAVASNGKSP